MPYSFICATKIRCVYVCMHSKRIKW